MLSVVAAPVLAAPAPMPTTPPTFITSPGQEEALLSITDYMNGVSMEFEPIYRVLLHYTNWSNSKEIAKKVHKAVPIVTFEHALRTTETAAANGTSIVITAPQDDAEMYESRLMRFGLKASLEIA